MRKCIITAASNLSIGTYAYLCGKITERFGDDISFERVTDDSVLGGFRMELDDTVWDLTIATQLNELRRNFAAQGDN